MNRLGDESDDFDDMLQSSSPKKRRVTESVEDRKPIISDGEEDYSNNNKNRNKVKKSNNNNNNNINGNKNGKTIKLPVTPAASSPGTKRMISNSGGGGSSGGREVREGKKVKLNGESNSSNKKIQDGRGLGKGNERVDMDWSRNDDGINRNGGSSRRRNEGRNVNGNKNNEAEEFEVEEAQEEEEEDVKPIISPRLIASTSTPSRITREEHSNSTSSLASPQIQTKSTRRRAPPSAIVPPLIPLVSKSSHKDSNSKTRHSGTSNSISFPPLPPKQTLPSPTSTTSRSSHSSSLPLSTSTTTTTTTTNITKSHNKKTPPSPNTNIKNTNPSPDVKSFLNTLHLPLNHLYPTFEILGCTSFIDLLALSNESVVGLKTRGLFLDMLSLELEGRNSDGKGGKNRGEGEGKGGGGISKWERLVLEEGLREVGRKYGSNSLSTK